ncbi:MAG TPA: hypothetical protein DEB40_05940 [Elusimicrobia bacterium]|nr:hypothetical protein [Elusimicrobiota bacterium]HBT61267.1 hypothetical protein [Elusimicrobiota bacterium]
MAPGLGGELCSVQRLWRGEWIELLYRADRSVPPRPGWRGGAPWLFPAVGRSFTQRQLAGHEAGEPGSWNLGAKEYPMPIHGFAMTQAWQASQRPSSILCRTSSDSSTLRYYPFDYELKAEYFLLPRGLRVAVEVLAGAANRQAMPFSIGNHITWALPFARGGDPGACLVRTPARVERLLSAQSLLTGATRAADYAGGVPLRDAPRLSDCVLGDFPSGEVWAELIDPASFGIRVSQREIPGVSPKAAPEHFCFVFYADAQRSFLCTEPWYGGPNSLNERRGLVMLEPGERFGWEMSAEFI